ncbi:MAG: SagB/ThcOx family dehydrogenase, partial [Desulfobacterales bacterium]|nr:SagB/ThcOx family dehydrogenase [Desulfobacterales bacterium]
MIKSSRQYHDHTSYQRDRMTPHYLDWQNQPSVFKDYPGVAPLSLPSDLSLPEDKLSALLKSEKVGGMVGEMDVEALSLILRLAHTLTAKARSAGGDYYFRSVASAGALYPTELYVATHSIRGLDDGLYHFAIHRHCLYPIRAQDIPHYVVRFTQTPDNRVPSLSFFLTAIFFRSAWKYRDRSYRYHLLDTGHLVENLVQALKTLRLPAHLSYEFDDNRVNELLGLDESKEVCLAVVRVPGNDFMADVPAEEIAELPGEMRGASQVAAKEMDYPAVREFHQASAAPISKAEPAPEMHHELGVVPETWTGAPFPSAWPEVINYSEALFQRRSRRNFVKEPLSEDHVGALLESICAEGLADPAGSAGYGRSLAIGVLAGKVEGMEPGFYLLDTKKASLGLVTSGDFMESMAHICLDQMWLANAATHFLFLTNLDLMDRTWGARGYRYAMLTA